MHLHFKSMEGRIHGIEEETSRLPKIVTNEDAHQQQTNQKVKNILDR